MPLPETSIMIYGTDLALKGGELIVSANGEAELCHNTDTLLQDIFLRLSTYRGTLFYNKNYGSYLYDFVLEENTEINRFLMSDEVVRRVEEDPRIKAGSASAKILYRHDYVIINLSFKLADRDSLFNLVLSVDKTTKRMELL